MSGKQNEHVVYNIWCRRYTRFMRAVHVSCARDSFVCRNSFLWFINLKVQQEEHIALVGENGAGKTTLMKLLMGLYPVSKGCISAGNRGGAANYRGSIGKGVVWRGVEKVPSPGYLPKKSGCRLQFWMNHPVH